MIYSIAFIVGMSTYIFLRMSFLKDKIESLENRIDNLEKENVKKILKG